MADFDDDPFWSRQETRQQAVERIMARLDLPNPDTSIEEAQRRARAAKMAEASDRLIARDERNMRQRLGYSVGDREGNDS